MASQNRLCEAELPAVQDAPPLVPARTLAGLPLEAGTGRVASLPCRAFVDLAEPRRTGAQLGSLLCAPLEPGTATGPAAAGRAEGQLCLTGPGASEVPAARHHPWASEAWLAGAPSAGSSWLWPLQPPPCPSLRLLPLDALSSSGPLLLRPPARLPRRTPQAGGRGTPTLPLSQDPVPRLYTPRGACPSARGDRPFLGAGPAGSGCAPAVLCTERVSGRHAVRLMERPLPAGPGAPAALGSPWPIGCAVVTQADEAVAFGPCLHRGCPESRARGGPSADGQGAGPQRLRGRGGRRRVRREAPVQGGLWAAHHEGSRPPSFLSAPCPAWRRAWG